MTYLIVILFLLFHYGKAQQTLFPAAFPLAVRSPYLSLWDQISNGPSLGTRWSSSSGNTVRCLPFTEGDNQSQCLSENSSWLGRRRAHRRIDLFFIGERKSHNKSEWYCECHRHGYHAYPDHGRCASWAHAI